MRAAQLWRPFKPLGQDVGETTEGVAAAVPSGEAAKDPGFLLLLQRSRGEVASERLLERLGASGRETKPTEELFGRLGEEAEKDERVAKARLAIAQRAAKMKPDASDAFLRKLNELTEQHGAKNVADLLTAAANSRQPNAFLDVITQLSEKGLSEESLANLGAKAVQKPPVIDLKWLNSTKLDPDTLEFLAADSKTPWDEFRRAALDPDSVKNWGSLRGKLRGAGAELVARRRANELGTGVRRQVEMDGKVIDYSMNSGGLRVGFEIKGLSPKRWDEVVAAVEKRAEWLKKGKPANLALTKDEAKAAGIFDHMIEQLKAAKNATKQAPYLGLTDAIDRETGRKLHALLAKESKNIGDVEIELLSEEEIGEAAYGKIGEAMGIPRP
jgi:hypothetical protein